LQLDFQTREITVKLVYYGPALSGKTTNLQAIHHLASPESRGRLMTLETRDDRTLFFDLLPLTFKQGSLNVRIKLFTVPGQVMHSATRRLVLQGADGVAFIADSQKTETRANGLAFIDLRQNLADNGLDLTTMPLVIQFNKRDMPDVRTDAELEQMAKLGKEPVYKAIATRGVGVAETFLGLFDLIWAKLEREHGFAAKFGLDPRAMHEEIARQLGVNATGGATPSEVRR
jgi:signal recognition particle receptor subunit beta